MRALSPHEVWPGYRTPRFAELEKADAFFWSEVFRLASATKCLQVDSHMSQVFQNQDLALYLSQRVDMEPKSSQSNQKSTLHVKKNKKAPPTRGHAQSTHHQRAGTPPGPSPHRGEASSSAVTHANVVPNEKKLGYWQERRQKKKVSPEDLEKIPSPQNSCFQRN